ncbi:MAG: hypothetical protein ACQUHE_05395, partial [Bacteroidia bacterium]
MKYFYLAALFIFSFNSFAQNSDIDNFLVKESLLKNSKLAIIAADSLERPLESINGVYTFSVSGFSQEITFANGVGIMPLQIGKSTFVYLKHENDNGTHSKLIYVLKREGNLNPITISIVFLIIIPIIIIILAFAFKKFIYLAVILLLIFMYFNHSNGLN